MNAPTVVIPPALAVEPAGSWMNIRFAFSRDINEELKAIGGFWASRARVWKVPAEQKTALDELVQKYREIYYSGGREWFTELPSRGALRTEDGAMWVIVDQSTGYSEASGDYVYYLVRKATPSEIAEELDELRRLEREGELREARESAKRELLEGPSILTWDYGEPQPEGWPTGSAEEVRLDPPSSYGYIYSVNDTAYIYEDGVVVISHYNADWDYGSGKRVSALPNAAELARRAALTEGEVAADGARQIAHLATSRGPEIDQLAG